MHTPRQDYSTNWWEAVVMREAVRSGRRTNFFITENRFIDCYAKKVGGSGVAVYSILQRCANSETRETWISVPKMAEVLDMDKSTVYRYLEQLENLRLIRRLKTREKTIYVVLPVPPPAAEGSTPLFDAIESKSADQESIWPPVADAQMDFENETHSHERNSAVASAQRSVSPVQPGSRAKKNRNKEEQDFLNKTQEQDFWGNKTLETSAPEIHGAAERIVRILGLSSSLIPTAIGAVKAEVNQTGSSVEGAAERIGTAANLARRRGVTGEKFLQDFLAHIAAQQLVEHVHLPATTNLVSIVTAAIKAEVKYTGLSAEEAGASIAEAASEDRRKGIGIDKFYFEDAKWRSHGRTGKGQQQFERIKRARDEAHAIIDAQM